MYRRLSLNAALLCVVAGGACDSAGCGDASCSDVLQVAVTGVDEFVLTLEVPGQEPDVRSCPDTCATIGGEKVVVFYGAPESAVLVVRNLKGDEIGRQSVEPSYEEFRPNGPTCVPGCRQATVVVPISLSCSDVACIDLLQVRVLGALPDTFAIDVEVPGEGTATLACPGACFDGTGGKYFFLESTPGTVVVTVRGADGGSIASQEFTPRYEDFRPNGPGCLPVCRNGIVALTIG